MLNKRNILFRTLRNKESKVNILKGLSNLSCLLIKSKRFFDISANDHRLKFTFIIYKLTYAEAMIKALNY